MPFRRITKHFRKNGEHTRSEPIAEVHHGPSASEDRSIEVPSCDPLMEDENLGLKVVHNLDPKSLLLDIVFIHGLTGNAFSTWQHSTPEGSQGRGLHWPSDLLKNDIPNARISLFGYDAKVASFWGGASQNRLSNHAEDLLGCLTGLREDTNTENRNIIFVTHSLGGLVVERALQLSEGSAETHLRRFEEFTAGILFLGTPHCGSDFASFAKSVGICLRLVGKRVNIDILDTLRKDSQVLLDVEDWFGHWRRRRAEANKPFQITCFYEELELPMIGKVVEEHQAKIMGYSSYGIHANHMNMTKFSSSDDQGYKAVRREIRRWGKVMSEQIAIPKTPEYQLRVAKLLSRLYVCPYENRKNVNGERIPGTCEWFTRHEIFRQWNEDDQSALLWVSADPGSGKSVLAKYLIDHFLPLPGITICYFFFKDGFPDQQSILNAICSLLHQLCSQDPSLVDSMMLQQSEHEGASFFDSFDRLWNIFVNLAEKRHAGETVCILDALDECQQDGFLHLSAKIRSLFLEPPNNGTRLKFLLTSRPYEHVRWEFQELEDLMPTIHLAGESEIEVEKIIKEIDLVIQSRVRSIGIKRRLTESERTHMLNLMTAVQNRTYLWVSLTLDVMERMHGFSRGNVIKSLETLPRTVDEAYENILRRSADPKKAFKALHLIVAARRPLSVAELSVAMVLNEHNNSYVHIQDLLEPEDRFAPTLRNLCGLFIVIIDRKIYFLHQTAREFLVCRMVSTGVSEDDLSMDCFEISWKHSIRLYTADKILAQSCIWYLTSKLPIAQDDMADEFDQYAFKWYASQYWHYHFRLSNIQSSATITQSALQLCRQLNFDTENLPLANPLATATYLGLNQVVKVLVETPNVDINAEDEYCRKPLSWAAERGFTEIVKMLLSFEHTVVDSRDLGYPRKTPFHHAAIDGHAEIVQLLLNTKKVNVNRMWSMASEHPTHAEIVHDDIWKSATHLDLGDPWTDTALCWAARNGHGTVVTLLLGQSEVEVDAKNRYGETALMRAETRGEDNIVELLLITGKVDVNAIDRHGLSVIERSTLRAQGRIVELLLRTGNVNVSAQKAAFRAAISRGDEKIVETLLSLGNVDANNLDEDDNSNSLDEDGFAKILDEDTTSPAFIMSNTSDQDAAQLVKTEAELQAELDDSLNLRSDLKLGPIKYLIRTDRDGSIFEEWSIDVVLPTDEIRNVVLHTHHMVGKETNRDYEVELLRQERVDSPTDIIWYARILCDNNFAPRVRIHSIPVVTIPDHDKSNKSTYSGKEEGKLVTSDNNGIRVQGFSADLVADPSKAEDYDGDDEL